jgi:hypothetical protein
MKTETYSFIVFGDGTEMGFAKTQQGAESVLANAQKYFTNVSEWKITKVDYCALGVIC